MTALPRSAFSFRLLLAALAVAFVLGTPVYSQFTPAEPPPMAPAEFAPDYVDQTWKWSIRTDTIPGYLYSVEESADLVNWTLVPNSYFYGNGTQLKSYLCDGPPPPSEAAPTNGNGTGTGGWSWQVHHFSLTLRMQEGGASSSYFLQRESADPESPNAWQTNLTETLPAQVVGTRNFSMLEWSDPTTHLLYWVDVHVIIGTDAPPTADPAHPPLEADLGIYEHIKPQLLARLLTPDDPNAPSNTPSNSKFARVRRTDIDSNGNGIQDWYEIENFATGSQFAPPGSPLYVVSELDADGDGFTNAEEAAANTDPNDATKHPPGFTRLVVLRKSSEFFSDATTLATLTDYIGWPELKNYQESPSGLIPSSNIERQNLAVASQPQTLGAHVVALREFPGTPTPSSYLRTPFGPVTTRSTFQHTPMPPDRLPRQQASVENVAVWLEHKPIGTEPVTATFLLVPRTRTGEPGAPLTGPWTTGPIQTVTLTIPGKQSGEPGHTLSETKQVLVPEFPAATTEAYSLEAEVGILPMEYITKGLTNDSFKLSPTLLIHGEQPQVKLDPVSNASVSVDGLTATLHLSGDVTDTVMGTTPQGGGADILKVTAFVNDSPSDADASLIRIPQAPTFWTPFGEKAHFSGLTVQIPATGIQRVRVETTQNAAGLRGSAEVEIRFSQTWSPPTITSAVTAVYDLIFPSALTITDAETIEIATEGGDPFASLLETGPNTKIFQQQSTGLTLWLNGAYAPTAQIDNLACTLYVPGGLFTSGDSTGGIQVTCQETGPQTLRFRHASTMATDTAGGIPSDTLESVTLVDSGPPSTAYPIAFRIAPLASGLELQLFGNDFPIKILAGQSGNAFATTQDDKPLIGFLVRNVDEVAESESLEFVYYDHASGALQRIARSSSATEETWKLKTGTTELMTDQKLPLKRVSMLNADGSAGEGFVPVEIDTLIAVAGGDTYVEIQEDSQFVYEFSGVKPGEVLRVASQDQPADRFDLVVPGATPKLTPHTRKADLTVHAPGIYRTQQKVVVYTTGPDGPQTLTDAQWQALKGLGYLAVHNGSPVVRCAADIDQFLADEGITDLHPPSDIAFGDGDDLSEKAAAFRHKGFTDHHAMNVYHNTEKGKKWREMLKSMFGTDFDPDEFTIPVQAKVHSKTQHLATQVWDDLIDGPGGSGGISALFNADGKVLPGVTSEQMADLRYRTWTAMDDSINAMSGTKLKVDRGRMRIWPTVLNNRDGLPHPLREKFLQGGWRMGSSASRYMELDDIVKAGVIKDAGKLARLKAMRKTLTKSVFKGGMKAVAVSLACSILKGYAAAEMAYGSLVNGWQETLAQKLNDELGLEDIDLARQIVSAAFTTDLIPGGTRVIQHQLPNGNLIVEGDPTFRCYWGNTDTINAIDHYIVTEMKKFPEGTFKMALVRTTPPHDHKIIDQEPPWFIRGWYPHVGAKVSHYWEAVSKAERNTQ